MYFRDEIKDITFLRVLVDYTDEVSMYKLLTMPVWNFSPREYMDLVQLAREEKVTVLEILEGEWEIKVGGEDYKEEDFKHVNSEIIDKILSPQAIAGIGTLLMLLDSSMKKIKDGRSLVEILYDFVMNSGYINTFLEEDSAESLFAVSNINKFFDLVKSYEKENPDSNIYEYVDYLNYSIQIGDSPLVDLTDMDELNAVNIMTVHSAKGLEFPVVFLVNLVSDRFPTRSRRDAIPIPEELVKEIVAEELTEKEANLQEERRLFYVGATRAKEKLYLTVSNFYGDAKRKKKPSVFLYEVLDRDVDDDFKQRAEVDDFTDDGIHLTLAQGVGESIIPQTEIMNIVKDLVIHNLMYMRAVLESMSMHMY